MSAGFANSHSLGSGVESTSSISNLSGVIHSPRQSLMDPATQNLYSTAQRYQQTNKQNLLKKLQTSVRSRRSKIFYGILCIIIFVLCYQWILYLMTDLHTNYNYNKPLFIQYISYTLYSILIGIPLIKPLWIISDKHHKLLITKRNTAISQYNNNYTTTPFIYKNQTQSNTFPLTFGFMTSDNKSTKSGTTDNTENEKKLSAAHSDINSTNSYEYDDQYDEFDNDSLLNDSSVPPPQHNTKMREDSVTELGMISELSFNHIHDTHDIHAQHQTQSSVYADSYDENNFSHSKQSAGTFTNKNGLLQPYFRDSVTSTTNTSRHNSNATNALKIPSHTKQNSKLIYRQAKSECGPLLDEDENFEGINLEIKHEIHNSRNSNLFKSNIKTQNKKIIISSKRDISHIPQSVHFELNLPDRTFAFFGKNIGFKVFCILFFINAFASVLWLLSISNAIEIHTQQFYIENSIHSIRVIVAYIFSVICLRKMSSIVNYRNLNLMNCQSIFCLFLLIGGLTALILSNINVFKLYYIEQIVTLCSSPIINGILLMYLQYISMQYLYKKNFYMFLGDVFFVLGVNGVMNLVLMSFVLLLSDFIDIEPFEWPTEWEIIWRLLLISFLWWLYNICVFIGIMNLNSIVIGFGFCLIIPCNIFFDTTINILGLDTNKEIFMLIGICLIGLSFIIYEMQFYIWYVMYCGNCRNCCILCRKSCIRWIHKKTQYRLYGKFQCCCKYRCCCQ